MTEEDKNLIAEYMNDEGALYNCAFDCNYASLCVQEMQKRGEWQKFCATGFVIYFERERPSHVFPENYIAWLFNAENFFEAMTQWLKDGKK